MPAVTLGVFIIWLGFLGFNGGSQSALAGAVTMSNVMVNTNLAASAGVLVAVTFTRQVFGRIDLLRVLNGAIGGLVAITAGPAIVDPYWAIAIGGIGGGVTMMGMRLLMLLKIDDEVGAISALVSGARLRPALRRVRMLSRRWSVSWPSGPSRSGRPC